MRFHPLPVIIFFVCSSVCSILIGSTNNSATLPAAASIEVQESIDYPPAPDGYQWICDELGCRLVPIPVPEALPVACNPPAPKLVQLTVQEKLVDPAPLEENTEPGPEIAQRSGSWQTIREQIVCPSCPSGYRWQERQVWIEDPQPAQQSNQDGDHVAGWTWPGGTRQSLQRHLVDHVREMSFEDQQRLHDYLHELEESGQLVGSPGYQQPGYRRPMVVRGQRPQVGQRLRARFRHAAYRVRNWRR